MKAKTLFSGRAKDYDKGRPAYSYELIDYIVNEIGITSRDIVADIGAGTGIFSRQLLEKGCYVICVEPNDDMRNSAQELLSDFIKIRFIDGNAEDTKLESSCVDFITVAQAFHWFDVDKFKAESKRILKDNGVAMLIWNSRDAKCDFSIEHQAIFARYCPAFKGFSGGIEKDDIRIQTYFNGKYQYAAFDNPIVYSKEQFISRCLSASYSIKDGENGFSDYIKDLDMIFEKYSDKGTLTFPNKSVIYWGRL